MTAGANELEIIFGGWSNKGDFHANEDRFSVARIANLLRIYRIANLDTDAAPQKASQSNSAAAAVSPMTVQTPDWSNNTPQWYAALGQSNACPKLEVEMPSPNAAGRSSRLLFERKLWRKQGNERSIGTRGTFRTTPSKVHFIELSGEDSTQSTNAIVSQGNALGLTMCDGHDTAAAAAFVANNLFDYVVKEWNTATLQLLPPRSTPNMGDKDLNKKAYMHPAAGSPIAVGKSRSAIPNAASHGSCPAYDGSKIVSKHLNDDSAITVVLNVPTSPSVITVHGETSASGADSAQNQTSLDETPVHWSLKFPGDLFSHTRFRYPKLERKLVGAFRGFGSDDTIGNPTERSPAIPTKGAAADASLEADLEEKFLTSDISEVQPGQMAFCAPSTIVDAIASQHAANNDDTELLDQQLQLRSSYSETTTPLNIPLVFRQAFAQIERSFWVQATRSNSTAGCCVVSLLAHGVFLHCANLGDCRAVLISLEPISSSKLRAFDAKGIVAGNAAFIEEPALFVDTDNFVHVFSDNESNVDFVAPSLVTSALDGTHLMKPNTNYSGNDRSTEAVCGSPSPLNSALSMSSIARTVSVSEIPSPMLSSSSPQHNLGFPPDNVASGSPRIMAATTVLDRAAGDEGGPLATDPEKDAFQNESDTFNPSSQLKQTTRQSPTLKSHSGRNVDSKSPRRDSATEREMRTAELRASLGLLPPTAPQVRTALHSRSPESETKAVAGNVGTLQNSDTEEAMEYNKISREHSSCNDLTEAMNFRRRRPSSDHSAISDTSMPSSFDAVMDCKLELTEADVKGAQVQRDLAVEDSLEQEIKDDFSVTVTAGKKQRVDKTRKAAVLQEQYRVRLTWMNEVHRLDEKSELQRVLQLGGKQMEAFYTYCMEHLDMKRSNSKAVCGVCT